MEKISSISDKFAPTADVKRAWVMHGPFGAAKAELARALFEKLPLHTRNSTVYVPVHEDALLEQALSAGLCVFLEGSQELDRLEDLKKRGYVLTLNSCWATPEFCAESYPGTDQLILNTTRLVAAQSFNAQHAAADVTNIWYSTREGRNRGSGPGCVLSITRTGLVQTPIKTECEHSALLAQMIRDMHYKTSRNNTEILERGLADWLHRTAHNHLKVSPFGSPRAV